MNKGFTSARNIRGSINASIYHPVASVIVSCIEKRLNFINRGLFEVRNLQAENFVSEKFTVTTYSRLCDGFLRDFIELQNDVEVHMVSATATSIKIFESLKPAKYRLVFVALDNPANFARGLQEGGIVFFVDAILPDKNTKYESIFSGFYSLRFQKFLYAENKGIVYFENKRMKALHRKASLIACVNTNLIKNGILTQTNTKASKIKQVLARESLVSDAFDLANGSVDVLIYFQVKIYEAIPILLLSRSLFCFASTVPDNLLSLSLTDEISFAVGSEVAVKCFQDINNIAITTHG